MAFGETEELEKGGGSANCGDGGWMVVPELPAPLQGAIGGGKQHRAEALSFVPSPLQGRERVGKASFGLREGRKWARRLPLSGRGAAW